MSSLKRRAIAQQCNERGGELSGDQGPVRRSEGSRKTVEDHDAKVILFRCSGSEAGKIVETDCCQFFCGTSVFTPNKSGKPGFAVLISIWIARFRDSLAVQKNLVSRGQAHRPGVIRRIQKKAEG